MRGILPGTAIAIRRINTNDRSVDEPISFYSMKDASGFLKRSEDYVSHRIKDGKLILSNNPDELKRQWYVVERNDKQTIDYFKEAQKFLVRKFNYSEDLPVLAKEQVAKFNREKNEQEKLSAKERQRKIKYYLHKLDLKYIDLAEAANKDDEDFRTLQTLLGVR